MIRTVINFSDLIALAEIGSILKLLETLLSFPNAFVGNSIIENYLKNGFPIGALGNDSRWRVSFSEVSTD